MLGLFCLVKNALVDAVKECSADSKGPWNEIQMGTFIYQSIMNMSVVQGCYSSRPSRK